MNIIEQLKQNERPFGRMSEEMQEKAREVRIVNFVVFNDLCSFTGHIHARFYNNQTYRLHPDYEDEPEIVECEITEADGHLHFKYTTDDGMRHAIHQACDHRDFIGFKFEDETQTVSCMPILYQMPGQTYPFYGIKSDDLGKAEVLHATHVLFRQKAKE